MEYRSIIGGGHLKRTNPEHGERFTRTIIKEERGPRFSHTNNWVPCSLDVEITSDEGDMALRIINWN